MLKSIESTSSLIYSQTNALNCPVSKLEVDDLLQVSVVPRLEGIERLLQDDPQETLESPTVCRHRSTWCLILTVSLQGTVSKTSNATSG
jgi:hypothetical protein